MDSALLSRVQGSLLGLRIGDALGMPWETMTADEILAATDGKGVQTFHEPVQRRIEGTAKLSAGDTTDDWQLAAAIARSLIKRRHFDLVHIAAAHVFEYDHCTFGWGRATRRSMEEIKHWLEPTASNKGRDPRIPTPYEPGRGNGNGVAMKVAPLALFEALHYNRNRGVQLHFIVHHVRALGAMTHGDPSASAAAVAIALFVATVMDKPVTDRPGARELAERLLDVLRRTSVPEPEQTGWRMFCDRLEPVRFPAFVFGPIADIRQKLGTECEAVQSVPFAIACFLRHPTDFRAGVLEAVNSGGDTDTIAAMVGAMIGANVGVAGIPEEWRTFRPEYRDSLELGEALYRAAVSE